MTTDTSPPIRAPRQLRIAIDAREYATSTGYYVKGLLAGLQKIDTKNHYIVLLKSKDVDLFEASDNFEKVIADHKEFTFDEQLGFLWQLNKLKPDVVHFTMVQQPILYRGRVVTTMQDLTTIRFRNPTKNPVIFWIKQRIYMFVNWYVAHKSNWLITPTEYVRHDVAQYTHVRPTKITATHEAVALPDVVATPIPSLIGKQFLLYIGRPQPHKNLTRLMQAHAKLLNKHPDLLLVLAGKKDAMYDTYERVAQELGTINSVVFPGWVTDSEKRWLMEHTIVFVAATLSEGFFISGIDAMWCGTPVASSHASCLPEVHGNAARYFDPYDVDDMARVIDEVMTNETIRQELITAGYENIKRFSWETMARQTLTLYTQVGMS